MDMDKDFCIFLVMTISFASLFRGCPIHLAIQRQEGLKLPCRQPSKSERVKRGTSMVLSKQEVAIREGAM